MPMVTSRILKFHKTEKSRYLENETFFLQRKKFLNYRSVATLATFVAEVTLKYLKVSVYYRCNN